MITSGHPVSRALIIRDPWIGKILVGEKTWEMRGRATKVRGTVGLIRRGGGVVAVADILGCGDPLSAQEMLDTYDRHGIPADGVPSATAAGWCVPWKMGRIRPLSSPVSYRHPRGAVTWIKVDSDLAGRISSAIP